MKTYLARFCLDLVQVKTLTSPCTHVIRVSVEGVESLWGDCRFGRLGVIVVDLCYFAPFEDFSL